MSSVLTSLPTTFTPLQGPHYRFECKLRQGDDAERVYSDLTDRTVYEPDYERFATMLPWTANTSRGIVADIREAPSFCLLDGATLTTEGQRAINPTPGEQTTFPRPPHGMLKRYRTPGLTLGLPVTEDRQTESTPISLPPQLQSLHTAWFGRTGSGKSTALITAMLDNHDATAGADILVDPKGDGMAEEYLRAHYARYGDLENVYYFDCSETLPALSFFDIREQLADGIDRTTAVEDTVDHYIEILIGIMGRDRFERAVRSPDIIRYVLKSLFDPVHGMDSFSHRQFQSAVAHLHETRDPPPVVDEDLQAMLGGVAANSKRSFDELMQGVANRIEKIPVDARLAQLFNHVHSDGDARFDLRDVIDEDAVVLIDTGGLRPESRRVVTLVVLSSLWTALRRRAQQDDAGTQRLVNLYLEEAAQLADSDLLANLLSQARSFDLSMTLAMQFPAQLQQANPRAYAELLNNVSTVVTGNVAVDSDLGRRLATDDMPPAAVQNRLRALRRGEWLVSLPAAFGETEPRPFLVESAPLPAGDPNGPEPLSAARETALQGHIDLLGDWTQQQHGLDVRVAGGRQVQRRQPSSASGETDGESARNQDADRVSKSEPESDTAPTAETDVRIDSALPFSTRFPTMVKYSPELHALVCRDCQTRYDPTSDGMKNAISCCHHIDDVDRDDVPICDLPLNLSRNERLRSPYTNAQLQFLQAVYTAHQRRFDPDLEYDLLSDSMIRLQEYTGITHEEVQELVDAEALSVDCKYPHKLYTVTAKGRNAIAVQHREGIAHGHLQGDLSESSYHVAMVEVGRRYIEQAFVEDDSSAAVEAVSYYEVGEGRLDAVGLDTNGDIVVALEAERSNHDTRRAVPEDFDKMAEHRPEASIWIVENRDGAHRVLSSLNEPSDGEPRVEKTYSPNSPPSSFNIDVPGFSEIYTFRNLRAQLDD
ncbi:ATP-binding protein [Halogeometricum pallidum]|nr:ATP-binding protein [Halogeometricum pallidum]